jgi:hypothetical protein
MKIYQKKKSPKKSWALKLEEKYDGDVWLNAVDADTGEYIRPIIIFFPNGSIHPQHSIDYLLEKAGYDPYEHKNSFGEDGEIKISK